MLPHLRPLDTGEILDGAFRLYRMHLRAFLAAGLLPLSPLSPLLAFWAYVVWRTSAGVPLDADRAGWLTTLLLFATWVPGVLTRGMVIRMADDAQTGRPVDGRAAFAATLRRFPVLLWASALTNVFIGLPVVLGAAVVGVPAVTLNERLMLVLVGIFVLGSVGLAAAWSGTLPAVMLERTSGNAGRGRSWSLSRGGAGKVAAVWVVGSLLIWLPWMGVEVLLALFNENTETGMAFAVSSLLCQATGVFTVPLVAASRTLLFNDLRVRVEALVVRVAAERLAPAVA
jgi:hypothetical protein